MHDKFRLLRKQLSPILKAWKPLMEEIRIQIRDVEDSNLRMSYLIEYNRFRELFKEIEFLKNDEIAIDKNIKRISSIKFQLQKNAEFENIGNDIMKLVKCVECELNTDTPKMHYVVSTIKRCINLIKQGQDVIPIKVRDDLIKHLNDCIIKRNKKVEHPMHGIIIQLREATDFVTCVAAICNVKCLSCNHVIQFSGNTALDIYAPIKCSRCNGYDLERYFPDL